jgi:glycerophosphoryl diester phosphodiesterase
MLFVTRRMWLWAMLSMPGLVYGKEPVVEIVGHRGASAAAPENTLAALRLSWDQRSDAVEFDVWQSRDGEIVLHHDADTKKTAGVDRRVDAQTFAELQQLDVGRWKGTQYTGERIPRLSEALALTPPGKRAFVEIKCGPEIVPKLKTVLDAMDQPPAAAALISFSTDVCRACVTAFPDHKVYWIVALKRDPQTKVWNHTAEELIETAKEMHVHGLDLQATEMVNADLGAKVRAAGLELYVWTVNDLSLAHAMRAAGVQGITTDRPGGLRAELEAAK